MKVVLNRIHGGFSISKECATYMAERGHKQARIELKESTEDRWYGYGYSDGFPNGYERTDPLLVEAVEALGRQANGDCASLEVIEIPDDINWVIEEYDGIEWVTEAHRVWP